MVWSHNDLLCAYSFSRIHSCPLFQFYIHKYLHNLRLYVLNELLHDYTHQAVNFSSVSNLLESDLL